MMFQSPLLPMDPVRRRIIYLLVISFFSTLVPLSSPGSKNDRQRGKGMLQLDTVVATCHHCL